MTTTAPAQRADHPQRLDLVSDGEPGLRALRERSAELSDIAYPGSAARFQLRLSAFHLGSSVLLEMQIPGVRYDRSPVHVARSGLDQYLVIAYLRGENRMRIGARDLAMGVGDVGVIDLAAPHRSEVVPGGGDPLAHHLTLILPRAQLAPLLAAPDAVGGHVIRGGTGYGQILRGLLIELWRHAPGLDDVETELVTRSIAGLVAGGLRPAPGCEPQIAGAVLAAKRSAIKRHLEAEPGAPDAPDGVDIAAVCRRFAISRASLYRMFEPDGGLVQYVREHRLRRAIDLLASPAHRHLRVLDIAVRHGFHTESGFIRAFRRRFGITPGELRAAARAPASGAAARRANPPDTTSAWLEALAAPPSSRAATRH
jgi:AraC-like DNA-binding protein